MALFTVAEGLLLLDIGLFVLFFDLHRKVCNLRKTCVFKTDFKRTFNAWLTC